MKRFLIGLIIILTISGCGSFQPHFSPDSLPKGLLWIPIDEIPVVYSDGGSGPPIVLLSPYPFNIHLWDEISSELRKSARVIVVEPPGLRYPRSMRGDFTTEHLLQTYRKFVRALDLGKVHMVGVGESGAIAVAFGHHFPSLIATAISINGFESVTWSRRIEKMMRHFTDLSDEKSLLDGGIIKLLESATIKYANHPPTEGEVRQRIVPLDGKDEVEAFNARLGAYFRDIKGGYITSMLPSVQFPVLLIRSEEDGILDDRYVERTIRQVSRVKVQMESVGDAGHLAFIDQPNTVIDLIQEFVSRYPS